MIRVPTKLKPKSEVPDGRLELYNEEALAFSIYERIKSLHKTDRFRNGCMTFSVAGYVPDFTDEGIITFRSSSGVNGHRLDFGDANCIQYKILGPGSRLYRFIFCQGHAFKKLISNGRRPFFHFEIDEVRPELEGKSYSGAPRDNTVRSESEPLFVDLRVVERQVLKELDDI